MKNSLPPDAQPANAVAVISQQLEANGILVPASADTDGQLFLRAGLICMTTAANIVGDLRTRKGMTVDAKRKAGSEALRFARMSDVCMARAAELGERPLIDKPAEKGANQP